MHSINQFLIFIKEFYETFFTFGLYSFFLFGSVASAATLRLHIPISTSWSGDSSTSEFSSSGYSLRGIFGLFGAGYTSSELTVKNVGGSSSKWTSNAVDFSITPIDLLTVGYGTIIGGALALGNAESKGISGSTTFFNLNFGLGPVDLLAGYRMWDSTHKYKYPSYSEAEDALSLSTVLVSQTGRSAVW